MSILQTAQGESAAILKSILHEKPSDIDWPAYVEARHQIVDNQAERLEKVLASKRVHAIRYLVSRSVSLSGAYSKAEPRVFTPEFVSELRQANSTRRALRNPWLADMLRGSSNDDAALHAHANVLPFGAPIAAVVHPVH